MCPRFTEDTLTEHFIHIGCVRNVVKVCPQCRLVGILFIPVVFPQLNASDDRGIGIVRGQILNFASTRTIFKSGFKLIILDEADAMTTDAQNALRRGVLCNRMCEKCSKCTIKL